MATGFNRPGIRCRIVAVRVHGAAAAEPFIEDATAPDALLAVGPVAIGVDRVDADRCARRGSPVAFVLERTRSGRCGCVCATR
jgi:hypothetical protein